MIFIRIITTVLDPVTDGSGLNWVLWQTNMTHKKKNSKAISFLAASVGGSLWKSRGFYCCIEVLLGGLRINTSILQFAMFGHQKSGSGSGSGFTK